MKKLFLVAVITAMSLGGTVTAALAITCPAGEHPLVMCVAQPPGEACEKFATLCVK